MSKMDTSVFLCNVDNLERFYVALTWLFYVGENTRLMHVDPKLMTKYLMLHTKFLSSTNLEVFLQELPEYS